MTRQNTRIAWEMNCDHQIHPDADFVSFEHNGSQVISSAKGMPVNDSFGRTLLDGIFGLCCVNIGHGRQDMAEAIAAQVMDMQYCNPFENGTSVSASQLGTQLAKNSPSDLNQVYYTCGGGTSNEAAVRIAQFYHEMRGPPNNCKLIARNHAYHGATQFAANLTGIEATKNGFARIGDGIVRYVSAANTPPSSRDQRARESRTLIFLPRQWRSGTSRRGEHDPSVVRVRTAQENSPDRSRGITAPLTADAEQRQRRLRRTIPGQVPRRDAGARFDRWGVPQKAAQLRPGWQHRDRQIPPCREHCPRPHPAQQTEALLQ